MAQWSVTGAVNHAVIVTHLILFHIMVAFNEPDITYTSLCGFIDILKELLFCHMFSYPKTYVMDVGWRKETEWHKLFPKVLEWTDLIYIVLLNDKALNLEHPFYTLAIEKLKGTGSSFIKTQPHGTQCSTVHGRDGLVPVVTINHYNM